MGMGKTEGLKKGMKGDAAIATANLILKFGSDADHVVPASAVTDVLIGVNEHSIDAAEDDVRVMLSGIAEVIAGGTVAVGEKLTTDANGKAVTAAPATGVNNSIIGIATKAGVLNDIITVLIAPSTLQG